MNINKSPSDLKRQLEAIMPAANAELAEEAVQLYADLQMVEVTLRELQKATESLTYRWARDGLARFISTAPFEHNVQFHEVE